MWKNAVAKICHFSKQTSKIRRIYNIWTNKILLLHFLLKFNIVLTPKKTATETTFEHQRFKKRKKKIGETAKKGIKSEEK